ncbi:MAG: hypothetical protein JWP13_392, partial [Candidatus Saccharibacteria bacterium]|nr:hypothetical protein [Candidatus Saccharibacteria bacterium]
LLRKRLVHPMYGKIGFLHGEPIAAEPLETTAAQILKRRTGLTGEFHVAGSGLARIFLDNKLESFTSFTLLTATIADNGLENSTDETGENFWTESDSPDFTQPDMLPSMADLADLSAKHTTGHFFSDKTYFLE